MAVDSAGTIYIADTGNNVLRKVDPATGLISTIAGTGSGGYAGDNGPATSARLSSPMGVFVDPAGNIYLADSGNQRIRKVDPAGIITTVAGNGGAGYSGDNANATFAMLNDPASVAVDSAGNIYIADRMNNRIRKVTRATGKISTVAGTGSQGFGGDNGQAIAATLFQPSGVALDASGNLYISDTSNSRIRRVSTSGIITTVAGNGSWGFSGDNGPATSAQLYSPSDVRVDSWGNIYIADRSNNRIRKVDASTGTITTVVGTGSYGFAGDNGPGTSANVAWPSGLSTDVAGNLYLADSYNNRVRKMNLSGTITTVAGNGRGDNGPATSADLFNPRGGALDSAGNFYFSDWQNNRICKVTASGTITTVAGIGNRGFGGDNGPASSAVFNNPTAVSVDSAGNVYIADYGNSRIRKVNAAGVITTVAGNNVAGFGGDNGSATSASLRYPQGVTADAAGNLYIADTSNHRIRKVSPSGIITTVAGNGTAGFGGDNGPATSAKLNYPYDISVDASGNLYIADTYNSRIRKVSTSGTISTVAGNGSWGFSGDNGPATSAMLSSPYNVTVDAAGNLLIADPWNHRIRKVTTSGVISTVIGTGTADFGGDNAPAISAFLNVPSGITVDAAGTIYISDSYNNRIRKVIPAVPPDAPTGVTAVAGNGQAVVNFNVPASNGGSPITSYTVTSTPGTFTASGTASPITVMGLVNGNTYTFSVTATSAVGTSPASAQSNSITSGGSYTVSASTTPGGTISPSAPQTVDYGGTASFQVTASTGYGISSVHGCGGTLTGTSYVTGPITGNCSVSASFAPITYTVTPSTATGGSIAPSIPQTVTYGSTTSFTVTPSSGYRIEAVSGCGGSLNGDVYTTGQIGGDCTVSANFTPMAAPVPALGPWSLLAAVAGLGAVVRGRGARRTGNN